MNGLISSLKSKIAANLAPKTKMVTRPDRALMMRYGALKLKCDGGAFLEIGAGVGGNAAGFFDTHSLDRSRGHLIEACPTNFRILGGKAPGFHHHNFAVAARDGTVNLNVFDREGWEGSSPSNSTDAEYVQNKFPGKPFSVVEVTAFRLDTFLAREKIDHVGFAIFNCEGSEYEIFSDDLSFLERFGLFYLDLHGRIALSKAMIAKKRDILARIEKAGFTVIGGSNPAEVETATGHLSFLFERKA